uniref:C2H2-type domain-containing protein n=1 Tax=Anopheles farauti TaxID=69004 RepID=A0A182QWT9_9DIPT
MDSTKCVICLENASAMVPLDTEVDVDELRISCAAMYGSITGFMDDLNKLNPECCSLKLCLACFTQLNDCFVFQKLAIQSAQSIFRYQRKSLDHAGDDAAKQDAQNSTEICTNLEVDILDEVVSDAIAPSPTLSESSNSLYNTEEETLNPNSASEQELPCEDCTLLRTNTTSYRQHYVAVHCHTNSDDCFQCTVCQRHFKSMRSFIRHIRTHQGLKQYVCQFCPKSFHYLHHLQIHERTHTHEKPFRCTDCPKMFAAKDRLVAHERTHRQHDGVVCDLCQKQFQTNKSLLKHKLIKHDQAVARFVPCECNRCGKMLQSQSAVTYHMQHACTVSGWEMQSKQAMIECDRCKEKFRMAHLLEAHLESQHGQRALKQYLESTTTLKHKYQCDVCGLKFKQSIVLVRHKQRHDGIRPYQCELCNRSFTQKGTLKTHMRRHTDEKPYECARCGAGFRSAASRRSHYMRTNCTDGSNVPDEKDNENGVQSMEK